MTVLQALAVLNLVTIALAFAELRPSTFIIAANLALVCLSMQDIASFGRPPAQSFVPESVFAAESIQCAIWVLAIPSVIAFVTALIPYSQRTPSSEFPKLPKQLLWGAYIYFGAYTLSMKTIFETSYAASDQIVFNLNLGGANALIFSIFIYEIARRSMQRPERSMLYFVTVTLVVAATQLFKGATGLAAGNLITASFLIFSSKPKWTRAVLLASTILASTLAAYTVRGVRTQVSDIGSAAVSELYAQTISSGDGPWASGPLSRLQSVGNAVQSATHVLECVSLYNSGISREWRSTYAPIVYTFEPSFLLNVFDLTRPKEAAWELFEYFVHGGGINTFGEFYWNGGFLCVVVMSGLTLWFAYLCDTRFRDDYRWLMLQCCFAPGLLMGLGYGFAQVSRGFFNGLIAILAIALLNKRVRVRLVPTRPANSRMSKTNEAAAP
ncbi:MAG: hypothetical protein JST54_08020 [Deltaproteobacteria bacterium]|nr:hypothetical protein [Deltaproteobacteria bacterium]